MPGGDPFDVCILDIQMPRFSGYDVAQQFGEQGLIRFPLIACSSISDRNAKRCEELGFTGFIPKPVNRQRLLRMVAYLLGEGDAVEPEGAARPILTQHSLREKVKHSVSILLAEDNLVNQKLARMMLEKAGYRVTVVADGREAVDAYTAQPDSFDLIFMDVQMPRLSGLEATDRIRQWELELPDADKRHPIPIIAMTAHAMKGDRENCLDTGMTDYVSKPIKRQVVFEMVRKWLLE